MIETEFLIVGSGPAGVSAAWPLVQAGRDVLMIDAADTVLPAPPREDGPRRHARLGADFETLRAPADWTPMLTTPRALAVLNGAARGNPPRLDGYTVAQSRVSGGLSNLWGANCSAFDAADMAGWPLSPDDLLPAYRSVAERIGISGARDDLDPFHGEGLALHAPTQLTPTIAALYDRYRRGPAPVGLTMGRGRIAVLTEDQADRQGCNGCGLCVLGCARRSIYSSADELAALRRFTNFRFWEGTRIRRFVSTDASGPVIAFEGPNGAGQVRSDRLLLAAGTIASTALVAEHAGLLGARLPILGNPRTVMAFVLPAAIGSAFPDPSFGLAQLSLRIGVPGQADYASGAVYGADTQALDLFARRMPLTRPAAMRLSAALAPALLLVNFFLPGSFSRNSMRLEQGPEGPQTCLDGTVPEATSAAMHGTALAIRRAMRSMGAYYVPGSTLLSAPGADVHPAGTMPMGGSGRLAVTSMCELTNMPGVHAIDGAWLPSLPAKHLTFTIMANALRVGRLLAGR